MRLHAESSFTGSRSFHSEPAMPPNLDSNLLVLLPQLAALRVSDLEKSAALWRYKIDNGLVVESSFPISMQESAVIHGTTLPSRNRCSFRVPFYHRDELWDSHLPLGLILILNIRCCLAYLVEVVRYVQDMDETSYAGDFG